METINTVISECGVLKKYLEALGHNLPKRNNNPTLSRAQRDILELRKQLKQPYYENCNT